MAEHHQYPLPPPQGDAAGIARPWRDMLRVRALAVALAVLLGSGLTGIAGGLAWAALAPRALFVVTSHGVAYVVNPETSAFIAADGWFCLVGLAGGAIIGLGAWLAGVRRHGPVPAAAALAGATGAAFLAWWVGKNVGLGGFRHQLGVSRAGALLRQPVSLGAHGGLAFWPLAAAVVIGGIELVRALRERQRAAAQPAASSFAPPAGRLGSAARRR
ncbi:MAG TPA: hypothetical protein VGG25_04635 [Streptosporangiaceae bacterium]|jgi:hypothetical protein